MTADSGPCGNRRKTRKGNLRGSHEPEAPLEFFAPPSPMPRAAGPPTGRSPFLGSPCGLQLVANDEGLSLPVCRHLGLDEDGAAAGTKTVPISRDGSSRCPSPAVHIRPDRRPDRETRAKRASAPAPERPITRERARPHPKVRRQRRRYVVKRRTAVRADLDLGSLHAEPVSSRGTLGIETLHSPARQILHHLASQ